MDVPDTVEELLAPKPFVTCDWTSYGKSDPIGDIRRFGDQVSRMLEAERVAADVVFDLTSRGMPEL